MYVGRIEKLLTHYSMVPMCIINSFGKVTRANKKIADVFKYDGIVDNDIFGADRDKAAGSNGGYEGETDAVPEEKRQSLQNTHILHRRRRHGVHSDELYRHDIL